MEMENMENFTYDGNYTDLEPLYSLKDNVSRTRYWATYSQDLRCWNILKVLHAQSFIINSIMVRWISDRFCRSSLRILRGHLSHCGAGKLHGHLHRSHQSSYAGLVMNYDSLQGAGLERGWVTQAGAGRPRRWQLLWCQQLIQELLSFTILPQISF